MAATILGIILGVLKNLPWLEAKIDALIAAYQAAQKARNEAAIAKAQKDSNAAETSDDIKKAAQEESDALKKL